MSSQAIKKSDLIEGNPFSDIAKDIEVASGALKEFDAKIITMATHLSNDLKKATTTTVQGIEAINKAEIESEKLLQQKITTQKKMIQLSEIERKANEAKAKAHEKAEKQYNKEIQQAEKASSVYSKVDAKLANMVKSYRDLAIKKEIGVKLTEKEQKNMDFLASKIQKYDSALKAVDANSGKYQRNVGNYKSAFDGLGFSVTQLTREMPAFANSMQTGFMAISNNLPMFFDEIQKLKQANVELKASGQPTQSVFKQLAGSLMSTQVLLSVGVTLLTLYGAKIVDWISHIGSANKELEKQLQLQAYQNKQRKESSKFVAEESAEFIGNINALRETNKGSKERAKMIDAINAKYGTTLKNLKDEKDFTNQLNREVSSYLKLQIENYRQKQNQEKIVRNLKLQDELNYKLIKQKKDLQDYEETINKVIEKRGSLNEHQQRIAEGSLKRRKHAISDTELELEKAQKRLLTYDVKLNENTNATNKNTDSKNKNKDAQKNLNTELEKTNEFLTTQTQLLSELEQIKTQMQIDAIDQQIADELRQQEILAEQTGKYSLQFLEQLLLQKRELQLKYLQEQINLELQQIRERNRIEIEQEKQQAIEKRDELLKQEGLTSQQKEAIQKQYQSNLEQIEQNELQRNADYDLEKKKRELNLASEKIKINKGTNDELKQMQDDLAGKAEEKNKKEIEAEKAKNKELLDEAMKLQEAITQYLEEQIDKRIDLMQKEADHAKQMQDYMQGLAQQGNIYANQSIAEQIQIQRDAQREIMRLQREKANIEAISAGLKTFSSEIEKGKNPAQALASTMVNTTVLVNLLKNLSFFEKGTMNAPEGLAVVDEKGSELITDKSGKIKQLGGNSGARFTWLNKGDKVYTATQTASIFEQVGMASKLKSVNSVSKSNDLKVIENGLKALQSTIQNKAETNINWQSFASGIGEIVSRQNANGVTTTNRFRVND